MPLTIRKNGFKYRNPDGTYTGVDAVGEGSVTEAVNNWLDNHPEATTTVLDGSLTEQKFSDALKLKTVNDYVTPEMFGAKGDGTTDDTQALQEAFNFIDASGAKKYLLLLGSYKITSAVTASGNGLFRVCGIDVNTSSIICSGANARLYFHNSESSMHEIDFRDFRVKGDHSQTSPIVEFNDVVNIYLDRFYVADAGRDSYCIAFTDCGIITCTKCLVVGSNDVENYPASCNGVLIDGNGSLFNFEEANCWNLNTVFMLKGSVQKVNIINNWIECYKNLCIREVGSNGLYTNISITGNGINSHSLSNFILSDVNLVKYVSDGQNANAWGNTIVFSHNTIYLPPSDSNVKLESNSVISIEDSMVGIINVFFDGNVFSGKTLTQLSAYVFTSTVSSLYVDVVKIRSAKMVYPNEIARITDDNRIISDVVPVSRASLSGICAPNGIYVGTDGETLNNGRIYYDAGVFYVYINGNAYRLFNKDAKCVRTRLFTGTTASTGNIAIGTSMANETIISVIGNDGYSYRLFVNNGNNFVKVVDRDDGTPIANKSVTFTIVYY